MVLLTADSGSELWLNPQYKRNCRLDCIAILPGALWETITAYTSRALCLHAFGRVDDYDTLNSDDMHNYVSKADFEL